MEDGKIGNFPSFQLSKLLKQFAMETSFSHWIKQRRKALDLTQADLARQVGCAVVTIQKIEEGRRRPSKQVAELLAKYLAIPTIEQERFSSLARGEALALSVPTNLPAPLTPLIGRAAEIATIQRYLERPDVRLTTVTGPPGVGKTRLGIQVASELRQQFSDGVWFVPLAPLGEPHLVVPTLARVLGFVEAGPQPVLERLQIGLRDKCMLLVLDNFEQVVEAAPQIAELLVACERVKVLTTSRIPLHLRGEYEVAVEPFPLPDHIASLTLDSLMEYEAIRLFVTRVQTFQPNFTLTPTNAPAIVDLCTRLDGLPLAIELAAARIRQFTPEALVAQLNRDSRYPLPLLGDGPRDLPARQQTLHNAIGWSYALLDEAIQKLFRYLGVFVGDCTLAAVAEVCAVANPANLAILIEQNLLRQEMNGTGEPRISMLEVIRAYALERLDDAGELGELQQRHANYYSALAQDVGEDEAAWFARMELEHDNLRATLRWFIDQHQAEAALRLSGTLRWFWEVAGYQKEGLRWLSAALALDHDALDPELRILTRFNCGILAWQLGDFNTGHALYSEGLELSRQAELPGLIASMQMGLGRVAIEQGEYEQAILRLDESLTLGRELNNTEAIVASLSHLSEVTLAQGDYARARAYCEEGLVLGQSIAPHFFRTLLFQNLGEIALVQGDYAQALSWLKEGLVYSRHIPHRRSVTLTLAYLAAIIGTAPSHIKDVQRAARIWGAVEALRQAAGLSFSLAHRVRLEHYIEQARAGLNPMAWAAAWAEGRAMSLEQTIEYALND
jgi:predicted ATPase/DNA-binding XRE family transcriptional regulator